MRGVVSLCMAVVAATAGAACGEMAPGLLPEWAPDANVERSAIPEVYRWDLTDLVAGDEEWEEEAAEARRLVDEVQLREALRVAPGLERYRPYMDELSVLLAG